MDRFIRIVDQINRLARGTCILTSGAIFILVMMQILFRYVFKVSAPWTEEAARYLMIWMALLACGLAFRSGDHFRVDFIMDRIGWKARAFLVFGMSFLAGIFILCVILWGVPFAKLGFFTIAPGLQITMFLPYLAVPVGGALMLLNIMTYLFHLPKSFREGEVQEEK